MPVEPNSPGTSGSSGAGAGSDGQNRKIGGKFDTLESAVEHLLTTGDRSYHETREEIGAIKQLLERAMTPIGSGGGGPSGYEGYGNQGYQRGRTQENEDDEINAAEFLSTPGKVLNRREAKFRQEMEARQAQMTSMVIGNAAVVLRFQMKNADLDEHEELVQSFLGKTNPRDPLDKRLKEAGKATRVYLAKIKNRDGEDDSGGDAGRSPDNDEYVEGAAGSRQGGSRRSAAGDDDGTGSKEPSQDDELTEFINERKQFRSSRFAPPKK
jgi:hypothetical protein